MLMKGIDPKKGKVVKPKEVPSLKVKVTSKKWEPKKVDSPKMFEPPNNVPKKLDEKVPKLITINDKSHQGAVNILDKHHE